jgi:hypothetical protein
MAGGDGAMLPPRTADKVVNIAHSRKINELKDAAATTGSCAEAPQNHQGAPSARWRWLVLGTVAGTMGAHSEGSQTLDALMPTIMQPIMQRTMTVTATQIQGGVGTTIIDPAGAGLLKGVGKF